MHFTEAFELSTIDGLNVEKSIYVEWNISFRLLIVEAWMVGFNIITVTRNCL